jgi:uncharacterized glyoxalase superfamily protein PhnB
MTKTKTASRTAASPMIAYEDAGAAAEWLARAFGFQEDTSQRYVGPDGRVGHAQMETDRGGVIMLASPTLEYQSPRHHREACEAAERWSQVPWVIDGVQVEVDDVDAHRARAEAAGARMLTPVRDEPYGRLYNAEDLEGHRWMFIQPA